jgi:hypothetical protein
LSILKTLYQKVLYNPHSPVNSTPFLAATAAGIAFLLDIVYVTAVPPRLWRSICPAVLVFLALHLKDWAYRKRASRRDKDLLHAYRQTASIRSAALKIRAALHDCDHGYEPEHEHCRAYLRTNVRVLLSVLGMGPSSVMVAVPEPAMEHRTPIAV